jgi:hypothetical protein
MINTVHIILIQLDVTFRQGGLYKKFQNIDNLFDIIVIIIF